MTRRLPKLPVSPAASSSSTRASMQGNRSRLTKPERALARALASKGLTGYIQNDSERPGTPDFSFPDQRIAIFVNGCYWHRCPYCKPNSPKSNVEYWTAKFKRNRQRDAEIRSKLRIMDWTPVVVWECILLKNPMRSANRIYRKLESTNA